MRSYPVVTRHIYHSNLLAEVRLTKYYIWLTLSIQASMSAFRHCAPNLPSFYTVVCVWIKIIREGRPRSLLNVVCNDCVMQCKVSLCSKVITS